MTDEFVVRQMAKAANSLLLPDQEILFDPDDYRLACVADHRWKTEYHDSHTLCSCIMHWRLNHVPIQVSLDFLNPDEREFLMLGHPPKSWREIFPPLTVDDEDDQFTPF